MRAIFLAVGFFCLFAPISAFADGPSAAEDIVIRLSKKEIDKLLSSPSAVTPCNTCPPQILNGERICGCNQGEIQADCEKRLKQQVETTSQLAACEDTNGPCALPTDPNPQQNGTCKFYNVTPKAEQIQCMQYQTEFCCYRDKICSYRCK
jgi:hypothetical protein